jgi:sorting nexin-8
MSLFGTSPPEPHHTSSNANAKSLFGDDLATSTAPTASSSLFADDVSDTSPWSMPTPKKAARRELVKNLLPATDVPETYIDAYDTVLDSKDRVGAGIGLTGIKNILATSRLSASDQAKILNFVVPGGQEIANGLGRSEFNVLLALIGLGQEGDDITLDSVDERRKSTRIMLHSLALADGAI